MENNIRVLIVDDSLFVRTILTDMLSFDPEIKIIGTAKDGIEAFELAKELKPDVVTMDLIMPRADGIEALKKIKEVDESIAVLMLSASDKASADAIVHSLELGAFDFILKPSSVSSTGLLKMKWDLIKRIKAATAIAGKGLYIKEEIAAPIEMPEKKQKIAPWKSNRVIAIGSSTGGPVALRHILTSMPPGLYTPIVIAQHMPREFTHSFADRLNTICPIKVIEAQDGETIEKRTVYLAPGNCHMELIEKKNNLEISLTEGRRIGGGRPSANLLFTSLAEAIGKDAIGVILTGMGNDGAKGLKRIKEAGGYTIAQDEDTSLIWGMPHAAIRLGVVDKVLPLGKIPKALLYLEGVVS